MDTFEKVERLVEKANVSYEDAKAALEEAKGDLLDAMIILEKRGKVQGPEKSEYVSGPEQKSEYKDVSEAVKESSKTEKGAAFKGVGGFFRRAFRYLVDNSLKLSRNGSLLVNIPLWAAALIILFTWEFIWIAIVISLFFGFRYAIEGKDDSGTVNKVLNQASNIADDVKENFAKKSEDTDNN
ncbi:MAG: hypothetical protein K6D56_08615 [Clostridia bacterium]|jgi:hypothetical protein|nr:hypothetical protein [Clostridia bacterium]